jgi:2'-5' RNA ligase
MTRARPDVDLGAPSDRSAVIVRARLPGGLERLRRRSIGDAAEGVPAHLTMLYPFVAPERLAPSVRALIADVAARHAPFAYRLAGPAVWPDTVYVHVAPEAPFVALQAALADAFPAFPIYGTDAGFEFVPHVSIAEVPASASATTLGDPGWSALPRPAAATSLEVIARRGGRWRAVWRIPLGGRTAPARR